MSSLPTKGLTWGPGVDGNRAADEAGIQTPRLIHQAGDSRLLRRGEMLKPDLLRTLAALVHGDAGRSTGPPLQSQLSWVRTTGSLAF